MYDLAQAHIDFPWTQVRHSDVEPWRSDGSGWFDEVPPGWGNVIHEHLLKLDVLLREHGAANRIFIEQVKEKWGTLRFYYTIFDAGGFPAYGDTEPWIDDFEVIVREMENATGRVCCWCGREDGLKWRSGWVHLSCESCERKHMA